MTRFARPMLGLALIATSPLTGMAQATIDSVTVAIDSRYVWRNYDRGGLAARGAIGAGLYGFSTTHSSSQRNDLRLELGSWNGLTDRATRHQFDQYAGTLRYGRCVAACEMDEWNKRWSVSLAANEYLLPGATGRRATTEGEAGIRGYWDLERAGSTQLGANLSPYLTVDRDFQRYDAWYTAAGISTFLDAIGAYSVEVSAAVAASDWRGRTGVVRSFGYHGSTYQLGVMRDLPFGNARHVELLALMGLNAPSKDIGSTAGVATVRVKLLGPIFR